jgi:regulator of replication initiation timing
LNDKLQQLEKELGKLKTNFKDTSVYNESLIAESKNLKLLMKEKETELKAVKSDCAQALLSKEKTMHTRLQDL